MKKMLIFLTAVAILSFSVYTQDQEARRIKALSSSYEVKIPAGTKLAALAKQYDLRSARDIGMDARPPRL